MPLDAHEEGTLALDALDHSVGAPGGDTKTVARDLDALMVARVHRSARGAGEPREEAPRLEGDLVLHVHGLGGTVDDRPRELELYVLDELAAEGDIQELVAVADAEERLPRADGGTHELAPEAVAERVDLARAFTHERLLAVVLRGEVVASGEDERVRDLERALDVGGALEGREEDGVPARGPGGLVVGLVDAREPPALGVHVDVGLDSDDGSHLLFR